MKTLDLTTYKFKAVTDADLAFPTLPVDKVLLAEAKERGFYNESTPFNRLFSHIFFTGGQIKFKKDVPEEYRKTVVKYMRAFMGSYSPKHEEKEAVCAMLLSEICEPEPVKTSKNN
jgi:hypothetical protein